MRRKKTLKELTIRDNFMFGAVMSDTNNCRRLLELILDFPIERVEVSKERSIVYRPEYKGVRLDVYAQDENNTHYNVEMQAVSDPAIQKRTRYYHSQIDMELLLSGTAYTELPDSYVIFICDFDPFGQKKYLYEVESFCKNAPEALAADGNHSIYLNTRGENREEVSQALVRFLEFVKADLDDSMKDYGDEFVRSLQKSVEAVKESREMEGRYMLFEELLQEERAEGKEEGRAEGIIEVLLSILEDLGEISGELEGKIREETDPEIIKEWCRIAAKCESIPDFISQM